MREQTPEVSYTEIWLTSSGLQVQDQQIPSPKLCAGKWKTPAMNFQSALTSTRQDLCIALPFCLFLSEGRQAVPSCLASAGLPVARISSDHFTTDMISCHVWGPFCFSPKHVMGILRLPRASSRPGKFSDKTANASDLSQLHGHSSPHKPKASSVQAASSSHDNECLNATGSRPSLASNLSNLLWS